MSENGSKASSAIDRLRSLQLGKVTIAGNKRKLFSSISSSKKAKHPDIIVAGLTFNSRMIENLSIDSVKTAIYTALLVDEQYKKYSESMLLVESHIRKNLKYTDDLICETFGVENFMKKI